MNWYKQSMIKYAWKFYANGTLLCEHCNTPLTVVDVTFNPKHFFNPGQLFRCQCQKSQLWTNSVRYPEELVIYCDNKPVENFTKDPEAWGFCNDPFCPYCWGDFRPLQNGYIYRGKHTDRYGCPQCTQNQNVILIGDKLGETEGQKYLAQWYKQHQDVWRNDYLETYLISRDNDDQN